MSSNYNAPAPDLEFNPQFSMFKNPDCHPIEFHYFASQIYYGEELGVRLANKLISETPSSAHKDKLIFLLEDEIEHSRIFREFILQHYGELFPESKGIIKVEQLCNKANDPYIISSIGHGILEPCSMVIIKYLRVFLNCKKFSALSHQVMRDEARHIKLIPKDSSIYPYRKKRRPLLATSALNAFRAMASIGKAGSLIRTLRGLGIDLANELPFHSGAYLRRNHATLRVVGGKLLELGIDIFAAKPTDLTLPKNNPPPTPACAGVSLPANP